MLGQDLPSSLSHEGSFSCGMNSWSQHAGSSSLTRDQTQGPCIGSTACNWATREVSSFPFFSWVVCFFCYCVSCLDILEIKPFLVTVFANSSSHSIGYFVFVFLTVSFATQKLMSLIKSYLFLFLLPWETDLRKHWNSLCQKMFFLWSLLGVL